MKKYLLMIIFTFIFFIPIKVNAQIAQGVANSTFGISVGGTLYQRSNLTIGTQMSTLMAYKRNLNFPNQSGYLTEIYFQGLTGYKLSDISFIVDTPVKPTSIWFTSSNDYVSVCETSFINSSIYSVICKNVLPTTNGDRLLIWLDFPQPTGNASIGIQDNILQVFTDSYVIENNSTETEINQNIINSNTQDQQYHQEIMQNNPSSFNNGIESIAGNTQLPNNSGLFDVLSSLSTFVGNLSASGTCNAISVPIPFTSQNFRLPCMTTEVYAPNFPELLVIWQLIVRGIVYYYIIVNFLKLLKDTVDPFSMKLEVLDL